MFWKKKQMVTTPVAATPVGGADQTTQAKAQPQPKAEKLPGPRDIPEPVARYLIVNQKKSPDWVWRLKAVVRKRPSGKNAFDVLVFDDAEAIAQKVKVRDYTSLDNQPDLILYKGWFDKDSKQVELEEKVGLTVGKEVTIFTEAEIQQKIEGLSEPGSTVFFYLVGSQVTGGPLGRGAAIVELNPKYPGEKQKKYIMSAANVIGTEPVDKGKKWYESDKPKEMAKFIKERHHKPSGY